MKEYRDKSRQRKNYKKGLSDKRKGNRMRNMLYEQGWLPDEEENNYKKKWK